MHNICNIVVGKEGFVDNKTILEPEDDAAHVNLGNDWTLPTIEQVEELIENTTNETHLIVEERSDSIFTVIINFFKKLFKISVRFIFLFRV